MTLSKTMRKLVAYVCAIAMVVASMAGYQASVSADTDYSTLTYTTLTCDGGEDIAYSVVSSDIEGWSAPWYGDAGVTLQFICAGGTINPADSITVKINGVETAANTGAVGAVTAGSIKINPTQLPDNAYSTVEITASTGIALVVIKKGTPGAEPGTEGVTETTTAKDYTAWTAATNAWTTDGVWNIWTGTDNGAAAQYKGSNTLDDYYVNTTTTTGDWSVQTNTIVSGLTTGTLYSYAITIESDKEGAYVGAKDDYSNSTLVYKTLTAGENVIEGTFVAAQANAKLFLEMGNAANTGATFHITGVEVKEYEDDGTDGVPADAVWTGWFEQEGWASYTIGDVISGYTLTDKNIGANWYSIQTGVDNVKFKSGVEYTCKFTLTSSAPKEFTVDNRSNDSTVFVEETAGTWTANDDGTYSYSYEGTYTNTTDSAQLINIRIALGYHNNKAGKTDAECAANDVMTFTLSDFSIEPTAGEDVTTEEATDQVEETTTEVGTEAPAGLAALKWEIQNTEAGFVESEYDGTGFTVADIPADSDKWSYGARLQNIPVTAGQTYTVSLILSSTVNKVIPVEFTNGTNVKNEVMNVTADGVEFSYKFTANADTVKLYMPLGVDGTVDDTITEAYSVTVSNVQLVESEPDPVKPTVDYASKLTTAENLAYQKTATGGPTWREGNASQLTDGVANLWDNYGGITVENGNTGYFDVDLGQSYSAASIDAVVVWWRTGDTNFYPASGYKIQFSSGAAYTTVAEATADSFPEDRNTAWADGAQMMVPVVIDKEAVQGNVQTVRIYVDSNVAYGAQVAEIAVISENPQGPVEVAPAADAAGVTVSSENLGEIKFNITAGENQEGYTYLVYLDDATDPVMSNCLAGTDYTITGVASGSHTIKVVSYYNGGVSDGIVSDAVTVKTVLDDVIDPAKNFALNKEWALHGGTSAEGNGSVTNGVISGTEYATPTKGTEGVWFTVDLGEEVDASLINNVYVWYRIMTGGCWPEQEGQLIQYSTTNEEDSWTTVATVTQDDFNSQRNAQGAAPFSIVADVSATEVETVRYIRIYYPASVAYGAQVTEIAVFGEVPESMIPETTEAPTTTGETTTAPIVSTLPAPAGLAHAPAGDGSLPYYFAWQAVEGAASYNVYINGTLVKSETGASYDGAEYFATAAAGEYIIEVAAVDTNGAEGEKASVSFTKEGEVVTDPSDVTTTDAPELTFETVLGADNKIEGKGNWSMWLASTHTMEVAVDPADANHIQARMAKNDNNWDAWSVQYIMSKYGLTAGETYTLSVDISSTSTDFRPTIDGTNYYNNDQTLTSVTVEVPCTADEAGTITATIGLGLVGMGVTLDFSNIVVKDAAGNVVDVKDSPVVPDETTEPTMDETTTEPITDETTTESVETTTAAPETQDSTTVAPTKAEPKKVTVAKTKVKKATKKKAAKKVKISLKKIKGAKRYQVQISKAKKFKKKNILVKRTVKKVKFTIQSKKIKNKKKLFVRARAIKIVNGKRYYGKWCKFKKVIINK